MTHPQPSTPHVSEVGTPQGRRALLARGLRPVLFSEELALALVDRVDWGEPDADGWYTPTFYKNYRPTDGVVDVPTK